MYEEYQIQMFDFIMFNKNNNQYNSWNIRERIIIFIKKIVYYYVYDKYWIIRKVRTD